MSYLRIGKANKMLLDEAWIRNNTEFQTTLEYPVKQNNQIKYSKQNLYVLHVALWSPAANRQWEWVNDEGRLKHSWRIKACQY